MGKLHELLAVETDLTNRAKSVLAQAVNRFGDITNYVGQQRRYQPLEDGGQPFPNEDKMLPGTVDKELSLVFGAFGQWLNASIQKEVTNQSTNADVIIDGNVLIKGIPTPALLNLESKLAELGKVLKNIPVNDPALNWSWSEDINGYISDPRITYRTEKQLAAKVLYEATEHHPAQVKEYTFDERVGEWTTVIQSGALQLAEKREILQRWEKLTLAVKQARQRANDIETSNVKVSEAIINYLRG